MKILLAIWPGMLSSLNGHEDIISYYSSHPTMHQVLDWWYQMITFAYTSMLILCWMMYRALMMLLMIPSIRYRIQRSTKGIMLGIIRVIKIMESSKNQRSVAMTTTCVPPNMNYPIASRSLFTHQRCIMESLITKIHFVLDHPCLFVRVSCYAVTQ